MMRAGNINKVVWVIPILTVMAFAYPLQASAWDRHGHSSGYRHYPHYPYGRTVVHLPGKYISVTFGTGRFFYSEGHFYRNRGHDYVVVPAPVGVVVTTIP